MGGGMSLTMAARFPGRVVAACSFHGGNLASDAADSPHLLAHLIKARVHVGVAREDASFPPEQAARLQHALREAQVDFVLEDHNARHGWTMTDSPVFDAVEAERHWERMLALFDATLKA
jgi:carboxymethylenebutenolidase